jgi:trigger factor
MKKNTLTILALAASTALALGGCAGDENVFTTPEELAANPQTGSAGATDPAATGNLPTILDYDISQYVTVGDYLNMDLGIEMVELSDEEKSSEYIGFLAEFATQLEEPTQVTDRAVEYGDVVCLDYCGKQDGVPFDGGTGTGYLLGIGSNTFIPGFEDGLIGWMPGEEQDLPIAFPEEYHNADLAGQEVVFTCTVQYIVSSDDLLAEANNHLEEGQEAFTDIDAFETYYYGELQGQVDDYNKSNIKNALYDKLPTVVTLVQDFPQELTDSYNVQIMNAVNTLATSYGIDAETYAGYFGQPLDAFVTDYAKNQLYYDAALFVIAQQNNVMPSDEDFNLWLDGIKASAGVSDEEFFKTASLNEYKVYYFEEQIADYVVEQILAK